MPGVMVTSPFGATTSTSAPWQERKSSARSGGSRVAAVANASAVVASRATTVSECAPPSAGEPERGSMMWCMRRPPRTHARRVVPEVATTTTDGDDAAPEAVPGTAEAPDMDAAGRAAGRTLWPALTGLALAMVGTLVWAARRLRG